MATVLEDLETAKANLVARLLEVTARPKPSYTVDGKSVDWTAYQKMLTDQVQAINRLIQIEGGPVWLTTVGVP